MGEHYVREETLRKLRENPEHYLAEYTARVGNALHADDAPLCLASTIRTGRGVA
jgi:hypothetical protein